MNDLAFPASWRRVRMKYVSSLKGRLGWQGLKAEEYRDEGPFVVSSAHFRDERIAWDMCPRVSPERYRLDANIQLSQGDVLLMKDGAALGKLAFLDRLPGPACLNSHLLLFRPRDRRYEPKFLYYYMGTTFFQDYILVRGTGATFLGVSQETIGNHEICLPPLEVQRAILAFLDRKTAAMDALIAKKERIIELLQEKRQALITRAVTKGLDPKAPAAALRNAFSDEAPKHWSRLTVRNLLRMKHLEVQDGNHGELHPVAADYVDEGIPFLMANNVRGGKVDLAECKFIPQSLANRLRIGFAHEGDVLLTHKGTLGETAILSGLKAPYAMLTPQVTYYRCRSRLRARYLWFFMRGDVFQEQLRLISSVQSTRGYVGITAQRDLVILAPPLEEQERISEYLAPRVCRLDRLVEDIAASTFRLREYRQALITAAVTGKIDVSSEAA